jgi:hypothetical protein
MRYLGISTRRSVLPTPAFEFELDGRAKPATAVMVIPH